MRRLMGLNYIEFLRKWDHIFPSTICCGLNASRGWKGLGFLEFNYMIMQSYDYELFKRYGCNMQFGGDDGATCWAEQN